MSCNTCRFWSELMAYAEGSGPVKAMCISRDGPHAQTYQSRFHHCSAYDHGAPVDMPWSPIGKAILKPVAKAEE